jgi:FO synthase
MLTKVDTGYHDDGALMDRLLSSDLGNLVSEARALRDISPVLAGHRGARRRLITFSPKVFIPLTRLCRDTCGYCTFAQPPRPGTRAFMTLEEVLAVAEMGASQGCTEALFTLGDKPELKWPEAAAELKEMGFLSTIEYVQHAAREVQFRCFMLIMHSGPGHDNHPLIDMISGFSAHRTAASCQRRRHDRGRHLKVIDNNLGQ